MKKPFYIHITSSLLVNIVWYWRSFSICNIQIWILESNLIVKT